MHVAGRISAEKSSFKVTIRSSLSKAKKVANCTLRNQRGHFTIFANGQMQVEVGGYCVPNDPGFFGRVPFT